MSDNKLEPAVRAECNVEMPESGTVYFDTVLETSMTVHGVEEDFVTYVIEGEVDNIHSDPIDRFLAWLAASRFIRLGKRTDRGDVKTTVDELDKVFRELHSITLSKSEAYEVGQVVIEGRLSESITVEQH